MRAISDSRVGSALLGTTPERTIVLTKSLNCRSNDNSRKKKSGMTTSKRTSTAIAESENNLSLTPPMDANASKIDHREHTQH